MIDRDFLLGKKAEAMIPWAGSTHLIHPELQSPLRKLTEAAAAEGFQLKLVSGFRSYEKQLSIWNQKAQGLRAVLDDEGEPLYLEDYSSAEWVTKILRWSALPGASRHHWGTDIDVIDQAALAAGETFDLLASECAPEGVFGDFHLWLDEKIKHGESFGFYRPYAEDLGGVAPEKWHLSYAPLSNDFFQHYDQELFIENCKSAHLLLGKEVLEQAAQLYQRFFLRINSST